MKIIRWLLLAGSLLLFPAYYFCTDKSPTDLSTPEQAGVSIILSSNSVTISDTAIIDSIGKNISVRIPFRLGYFIDSIRVEVYSDESLAASLPADTTINVRFSNNDQRDTLRFTLAFETPGTKRFKVTAFKQLDYVSYAQATAIILGSTNAAGNTPPEFLSETPRSLYKFNDGDTVRITAQALDVDGDVINYVYIFPEKKVPRPSTIVFANGYFEWKSEKGDTGVYPLLFTASDKSSNVKVSTVIVLGNIKYNSPPMITTTPELTAEVGLSYKYKPVATDLDSGDLVWSLTGTRPSGLYFDSLQGTIFWVPDAATLSSGRLTLSVTDNGDPKATTSQSFTIKVNGVNRPPIARAPNGATAINTPIDIILYAMDPDNDHVTFKIVRNPPFGSAKIGNDSVLTYSPSKDFKGVDTLYFTAEDAFSSSDTTRVLIFVGTDNQKPVAQSLLASGVEDAALTIHLAASDVENSPLTYTILKQPQFGKLEGIGADRIYTPNQHFNGSDTLLFSVNDRLLESDPAKVIIVIAAINDTPTVGNIGVPVAVNTPVVITLPVTDPDDSVFTYEVTGGPANGKISATGSVSLLYTPNSGFFGNDTMYFKVFDSNILPSATGRVIVVVGIDNKKPVADRQSVSVAEEGLLTITLTGNDPEKKPVAFNLVKKPLRGTSVIKNNIVTYQPYLNFCGFDTLAFTVNDSILDSDPAMVVITVLPVNDPPTLQSQSVAASIDGKVLLPLMVNDVDDTVFTFKIAAFPLQGMLDTSKLGQKLLYYTPNQNSTKTDVVKMIAFDASGSKSDTAVLSITIIAVNQEPTAENLWVALPEDATKPIFLTATDETPSQDLIYGVARSPKHGLFEGNFPAISFKAEKDYNGPDTFWYWAKDPQGLKSDSARVVLTITPVNDLPVIPDADALRMVKTAPGQMVEVNGLNKADDADDPVLVYSIVTWPKNGSVDTTNFKNGVLKYTPASSFQGADSIVYQAMDDEKGASNRALIIINVTLGNQAPVALSVPVTVKEDDSVQITLSATDAETRVDLLKYAITVLPKKGTVSAVNLQKFWYKPAHDSSGVDELFFTASDSTLTSTAAKVTITITPVNDPPVAHSKNYPIREDSSASCLLTGYDPENAQLSFIVDSLPKNGTVTSGTGASRTYQPNPDYNGADSFAYHVNDGGANSAIVKVRLTMSPRDDRPYATSEAFTDVKEDVVYPFTLEYGDVDGQTVMVTHKEASRGEVTKLSNGSYTYLSDKDYFGKDSFTFFVSDGLLTSDTAKVVFTIAPVNDAPVATPQSGLTVDEDGMISVVLRGSDPDGDALRFAAGGAVNGGLMTSDSIAEFTPVDNYSGSAHFTFTVSDGKISSAAATIDITVAPVNDAPKIGALSGQTIAYGESFNEITLDDFVADADDADNTLEWSTRSSGAGKISVTIDANRHAHITAAAGWSGVESVTFIVNDLQDAGDELMISFGVAATPDNPPTISTINDTVINVNSTTGAIPFTIGDDKTPVTQLLVSATSNDAALVGPTGIQLSLVGQQMMVTVTPIADKYGSAGITIKVEDNNGQITTETFTVRVNAIPVTNNLSRSIPATAGSVAEFSLSEMGSDIDGSIVACVFTPDSENKFAKFGTVVWENNKIIYTLGDGASLEDTDVITYQVRDNHGALSVPKTITISMNLVH